MKSLCELENSVRFLTNFYEDPQQLMPFQHEDVVQVLLQLAEQNKVIGYRVVTISDPNKYPPQYNFLNFSLSKSHR